ncbi:hypothetical protein B0H14DRAFT_2578095 [Mycena olivaceomarginata]|nr:hypothetical protein B0H14DRAFT_2578095 [Mycena olivaceomarginata]
MELIRLEQKLRRLALHLSRGVTAAELGALKVPFLQRSSKTSPGLHLKSACATTTTQSLLIDPRKARCKMDLTLDSDLISNSDPVLTPMLLDLPLRTTQGHPSYSNVGLTPHSCVGPNPGSSRCRFSSDTDIPRSISSFILGAYCRFGLFSGTFTNVKKKCFIASGKVERDGGNAPTDSADEFAALAFDYTTCQPSLHLGLDEEQKRVSGML